MRRDQLGRAGAELGRWMARAGFASDEEFRRLTYIAALAASIDRTAISAKITLGKYPVADSDRPRSSWAHDAAVREPGYDPAAADRLLDAAGWSAKDAASRARSSTRR